MVNEHCTIEIAFFFHVWSQHLHRNALAFCRRERGPSNGSPFSYGTAHKKNILAGNLLPLKKK